MINVSDYVPVSKIRGDSAEDTLLLSSMSEDALEYIKGFKWCPPIKDMYFAFGVGGIIALFLVEFLKAIHGRDRLLWIVVGDLPKAYMVADYEKKSEILLEYVLLMESWASAVENGNALDGEFPVDAAPTLRNAKSLKQRMKFLRKKILPLVSDKKA